MSEVASAPSEAGTVWEAAANLAPVLAASLWGYIAGLFDARDLRALRVAALDVTRVIPGSTTHFKEVDLATGEVNMVSDPPAASAVSLIAAYTRLRHEHPVIGHYEQGRGGASPLAISDLADECSFSTTALFTDVFRGIGIADQLVIPVPLRHPMARVSLCIGREGWGFSEAEHVAALLIQRSLRITYAALWQRESARTASGLTGDLLARSGVEIYVVDRFGEIISLDGDTVRLDPALAEAVSCVRRLAHPTTAVAPDPSQEPARESGPVLVELKVTDTVGEPVTVQLLASQDGEFWPVLLKRVSSSMSSEDLVGRGLTQRQAAVMALLLAGRTTGAAALELGISPRTAEKHIQLACHALGVHSRTDALLALATGADGSTARDTGGRRIPLEKEGATATSAQVRSMPRLART